LWAAPALAQDQAPGAPVKTLPPLRISGNVSFGLGQTSGNKDTLTFNGSYDLKFDQRPRNVLKSNGLLLYGKTGGELSTQQYRLWARDEYTFDTRAFAYAEVRYLHDLFKGIRYLVAPTAGFGYKIVNDKRMTLSLSAGAGGAWEQDYDVPLATTGAVTFEEKFTRKISAGATIGQSFSTLWNIADFGDALYLLGANVTSTLVGKAQLKIEVLDSYKTRPPLPGLLRNDLALITSIVYKF
jgi:hypothetical protein